MSFLRKNLRRIHDRTAERHHWYRRWHETPYHRQVHYAVAHLVGWPLVAVIVTSLIVTTTSFHLIWDTQQVRAAGRTWTSQVDWQAWTKSDTVATSAGAVRLASSATTPGAVTTISAGSSVGPYGVMAAANGMIYATTTGSNSKTLRIDPATGSIVNSITLAIESRAIANGSDGYLYIGGWNSLVKLDPATDTVVATYVIDDDDWAIQSMVLAPNGDLYVVTTMRKVYRFDTDTGTVLATIPCGYFSVGLAVAPNGMLYVSNANDNNMTVIDTNTDTVVTTTAATLSNPQGVTVDQDGYIYVANRDADTVAKIDPNTYATTATIAVGQDPFLMLTDSDGIVWVSNLLGSSVSRINPATNSVLSTITVGTNPRGIGQGLDGQIYVVGGSMATSFISRMNPGYSFSPSGTANTVFTPSAGQTNTWNSAVVTKTEPSGTSVAVAYSNDNATWKTDLALVPASESLYIKADFASSSAAVTPVLSSLAIDYDPVVGGGDPPSSNSNTNSNANSNTGTNTETNTITNTVTNTDTGTNVATNTNSNTDTNEPVTTPVAKPTDVSISIGSNQVTVNFAAPPAGHRIRVWRSLDAFSNGLLIESVDGTEFTEYLSTIQGYNFGQPLYYYVDMFRQSDQAVSEKVGVSATFPTEHVYGIVINTRNVTAKPGEVRQLSATVFDAAGNQVDLPVSWSLADEKSGTITSTGLFTAGNQTGYWSEGIRATVDNNGQQGLGTTSVAVDRLGSVTAAIYLGPDSVTLQPGQQQTYYVYRVDQYGERQLVSDQSRTIWRSSVGSMAGNVLTAGDKSTLTNEGVTATYTDDNGQTWVATGRVAVSTEKPYLNRVFMTGTQRLSTGATYRYTSWGYDQFNNYLSRNITRSYQSTDTSVAVIDSAGTVHVGDQVGCFYWMLRSDQTYDGRSEYGLSGVVTKPFTESQIDKLDQTRIAAWRQVRYVYQPGEQFQLSAYIYTGWGIQAPGEYAEYEMADPNAGSITKNGLFTASGNNGTYKGAINVYIVNTQTGERRFGTALTITVANEASTLTSIATASINTRSNWHWSSSAALKDQFGYPYRGAFTYRWSIAAGNSAIKQNGIVNTGAPERTAQAINLAATTSDGRTLDTSTRGSVTSSADYNADRNCNVTGTITNGGLDGFVGPDGEWLYYDEDQITELTAQTMVEDASTAGTASPALNQKVLLPISAAAVLVALPGLASALMQVLGQSFSRLGSGLTSILQLIGLSRRALGYGLVTTRRRRPVKGARVELLAPTDRRVVETQITDQEGRYAFRQNPTGLYIVRVTADGYAATEFRARGAMIHRHVKLGLNLENDDRRLRRLRRWSAFARQLVWISLIILAVGTASWFVILAHGQWSLLIELMGVYYALAWLLEWLLLASPRPFGVIKDAVSGAPIALATVRIIDQSGRVVATEVTDQLGRYRALLASGQYDFVYSKLGYQSLTKRRVAVARTGSTGLHVKLSHIA